MDVEIIEAQPEVKSEPVTEEGLKDAGMVAGEIDLAKKHDIIGKKEEPAKVEEKKEEKKEEPVKEPEKKPEEKKEEPKKEDGAIAGVKKEDVDEKSRWIFNEMKKERFKRREAQAERDKHYVQVKVLEKEINELKRKVKTDDEEIDKILGEDKNKKDIEIAPLDEKELKEMKARRLQDGLKDAESDGKMKYHDFDNINILANEVLEKAPELFKDDKKTLAYARQLYDEMMYHAYLISEGKEKEDDRSVADIVYELGTLNPKYNSKKDVELKKDEKSDGKKNADIVEKVLENAKVRTPSAAIGGGGGKTIVTEDDLTPEQAVKLSTERWLKLKPETRERILKSV
ncbi:MAG: hypothetical protein WC373_00765 [Smithella sp.]|jgi:hypothetical protein